MSDASVIDLERDQLAPVAKVCEQVLGTRKSPATLHRWRVKGVQIGQRRIRLEAVRVAGRWCTTRAAFADFVRRQTEAANERYADVDDPPAERDPATEKQLRDAGLLG